MDVYKYLMQPYYAIKLLKIRVISINIHICFNINQIVRCTNKYMCKHFYFYKLRFIQYGQFSSRK